MSNLSRKAYEKRVELELRARFKLRNLVLLNTTATVEAVEAAGRAEVELGSETGFTITASRGAPFEAEWFDLDDGAITLEDAAKLARDHRGDPRLAGWAIRVFAGRRSSGFSLREVMCLSELL